MPFNLTASPNPSSVDYLARKSIVPSPMRSDGWAEVQAQLRDRAQFSAGIENVKFLQAVQDKLLKVVNLERERVAHGDAYLNRDSFIADLRQVAREEGIGTGAGDLTDLQSSARLGLIYDMQVKQAFNFARWKMDQNQDILDAFPAQELLRVEERLNKRDWQSRWIAAGGKIYNGFMLALKNDPIWTRISIFGTPWPPFDWGSGMGLRDVSRQAAIDLGLIAPGERIAPDDMGFNDNIELDVSTLSPVLINKLAGLFGDLVQLAGNKLKWIGS